MKNKYFYNIIVEIFENNLPKFSSYYHVFISIIDSLEMMNIIKQEKGNSFSGKETIMFLTEHGEGLLSEYFDIVFENAEEKTALL